LTDALKTLVDTAEERGGSVRAVIFDGRRYDTGDKLSYIQATIQLACGRADLGPDLRPWLTQFVASPEFAADNATTNEPARPMPPTRPEGIA